MQVQLLQVVVIIFFLLLPQGSVNFHLQYCYCPTIILPLNIHQFSVTKIGTRQAELKWIGFDDYSANYHYEVEVSRDGYNFSTIGSFAKKSDKY